VDSDQATATFHTLLPTGWSTPFGLDSAGTTGEVEIQEGGASSSTLFGGGKRVAAGEFLFLILDYYYFRSFTLIIGFLICYFWLF
jgi:hypothetical protein